MYGNLHSCVLCQYLFSCDDLVDLDDSRQLFFLGVHQTFDRWYCPLSQIIVSPILFLISILCLCMLPFHVHLFRFILREVFLVLIQSRTKYSPSFIYVGQITVLTWNVIDRFQCICRVAFVYGEVTNWLRIVSAGYTTNWCWTFTYRENRIILYLFLYHICHGFALVISKGPRPFRLSLWHFWRFTVLLDTFTLEEA